MLYLFTYFRHLLSEQNQTDTHTFSNRGKCNHFSRRFQVLILRNKRSWTKKILNKFTKIYGYTINSHSLFYNIQILCLFETVCILTTMQQKDFAKRVMLQNGNARSELIAHGFPYSNLTQSTYSQLYCNTRVTLPHICITQPKLKWSYSLRNHKYTCPLIEFIQPFHSFNVDYLHTHTHTKSALSWKHQRSQIIS